mmetsp:Transcript_33250/g.60260  ORF Transcript_33250/g.60260 Transcript_33250/m.60260 type:complete len:122 (-) Transcript_33250:1790-2155(-)
MWLVSSGNSVEPRLETTSGEPLRLASFKPLRDVASFTEDRLGLGGSSSFDVSEGIAGKDCRRPPSLLEVLPGDVGLKVLAGDVGKDCLRLAPGVTPEPKELTTADLLRTILVDSLKILRQA